MKPLGEIYKSFDRQEGRVSYYKTVVSWNGKKKTLELPRHDPALGWIEIFGFPPQHEWVVLNSFEPFKSKATLKIDGKSIEETMSYIPRTDKKEHYIKVERKNGTEKEIFEWTENYSENPKIIDTGIFTHKKGKYSYKTEKNILNPKNLSTLSAVEIKYYEDKKKELGEPSLIITKDCVASGAPPPIFSEMFFVNKSDVVDCRVRLLELGYLGKEESDLEKAHGDWYKLVDFNSDLFEIQEKCGAFRKEIVDGKPIQIKDSYTKTIYKFN